VNALSWILFAGCCAGCFAIGWITCGWRQEVAEFRAEDERDAAWDRDYQQRGMTLNVNKPIIPVASASSEPATPPPPLNRDQAEAPQ
jgi:hypothetical protein